MKTILMTVVICVTLLSGNAWCGSVRVEQKQSNLAAFLFGGETPQHPARKVPLTFPARVGVTFVPGEASSAAIPEATKQEMVEAVRAELAKHTRYVAGAQSIPSMYLMPRGGVNNLEQVAGQFDVDVIVILGASQFQKHERNPVAAFLDLTIIGAFTIPGNTVDTATVLEAAVYHVPSRSLVFRADGTDRKSSRATSYGSNRTAHNDAVSSIEDASQKLVRSIGEALVRFENYDVSRAAEIRPLPPGTEKGGKEAEDYWGRVGAYRTTGGGSMDMVWILMTGGAILCSARIRTKR